MRTTFNESVNQKNLNILLDLTKDQLQDLLEGYDVNGKEWETKHIYEGLKNLKSSSGVITQKYKHAKNFENGRLYVKRFGLQSLPRKVRGFLSEGTAYKDYDLVNCHYSIISNLCDKHNIECLYVKQYVDNRKKVLADNNLRKKSMITFCYMDKPITYDNQYLKALKIELENIKEKLINIYHNYIDDFTNKKNPISSQFSQILQHFESEIISSVIDTFKLDDCVLMFDGFQTKTELDIGKLYELTGYKWDTKPFETLEIDDDLLSDYERVKKEFELNNFISLEPLSRYTRINENYDYVLQSKQDFEDRSQIYEIQGERGPVSILARWMKDPNKRHYHSTVFNPDPNFKNDYEYNLFKKFKMETYKQNKPHIITEFKTLIKSLTGGCEKSEEYLMCYLAHLVQKPHINPEVCVVLKGNQGCGKDTLTNIIEKMMGRENNYLQKISDLERVTGNFTECLDRKLVVQINEMDGKDGCKFNNKIKDMITTEDNIINKKYAPIQKQKNYIRWFIYSNNLTPVVIEQTDRRFFVCETDDTLRGNVKFWNRFNGELLYDDDYISSIYQFLKLKNITNWNPRLIPMNSTKKYMKRNNTNPLHKFLKYEYDTIEFKKHTIKKIEYDMIILADLFDMYQDYEEYNGQSMKDFKKWITSLKGVEEKRPKFKGQTKIDSRTWLGIRKELLDQSLDILVDDVDVDIID